MIKILLNGSEGQMGKAIAKIVEDTAGVEVVISCDAGKDVNTVSEQETEEIHVVVDMSSPDGFRKSLKWAVENGKPFVAGATGLNAEDMVKLKDASEKIAVLHTSNLSQGMNILFEVLKKIATLAADADIEIVEMHHNRKKDAPSGTALTLGKIIKENQPARQLNDVRSRSGIIGERSQNEIGYSSIRCGDVPGEHTVIFAFEGERIELTHRALTRDIFARGAISAVKFLAGKPSGKYSMKDVVNPE